jgi:hypothetical protein
LKIIGCSGWCAGVVTAGTIVTITVVRATVVSIITPAVVILSNG